MLHNHFALDLLWALFWKLPFSGTTKVAVATIFKILARAKRYMDKDVLTQEVAMVRALPSPFIFSAAWHFGYTLGGWVGRFICAFIALLPNVFMGVCFALLYWLLGLLEVFSPLLLATQAVVLGVLLIKALGLLTGKRALPYTLSLGWVMGLSIFAGCPLWYALVLLPMGILFFTGTTYYLRTEPRSVLRTWQSLTGIVCTAVVVLMGYHWVVDTPLVTPEAFWSGIVLGSLFCLTLIGHGLFRLPPWLLVVLSVVVAYILL